MKWMLLKAQGVCLQEKKKLLKAKDGYARKL